MELTSTQLTTLKNAIAADPVLSQLPNNSDAAFEIAAAFNVIDVSNFTVWKTSVQAQEIMSNGFVWTAVDTLTVGKARIWEWMTRYGTINPSKANIRQGLADCFGAGSAMATAIMPHLKRLATRAEKLFATGTGTDQSPGNLVVEGQVTYQNVLDARSV